MCCEWCGTEEGVFTLNRKDKVCDECYAFDLTFDIDEYEERKRERIAEENEY